MEELHGITKQDDNQEDPASLDVWLQILDMRLNAIKRGSIYEVAEAMDRRHVTNRAFRMMFLRANQYDPEAAAKNILEFLEIKRCLFGQERLVKKISLEDLEEEDRLYIERGSFQVTPCMDRSGRQIIVMFPSLRQPNTNVESEVRARFYIIMSRLESEDIQINGVVVVYFDATLSQSSARASQPGLLWIVPVNIAGIHFCFSKLAGCMLVSLLIYRLPEKLRPRVRIHYGSSIECQYKIESFGIPRGALQLTATNEPTTTNHIRWYRHRQKAETRATPDPEPQDVLFGRLKNNGGNMLMRKFVLQMLDEHKASNKTKKTEITDLVISEIRKTGGRFLRQDEETGLWEEVSHTEANRKIAHIFRNIRRPSRAKSRPQP